MILIKRTLWTIIILATIGIFFRGWFYRYLVTYKTIGQRQTFSVADKKLIQIIKANIPEKQNLEIKEIIKIGLDKTSEQLNFTTSKNETDPNKLITTKTANCVGYASFFATMCNFILNENKLGDTWKAKSQIGQLYVFGENIHKYFNSPFFKDHDFVIIENEKTGEIFAVDPTINDYLNIEFISFEK